MRADHLPEVALLPSQLGDLGKHDGEAQSHAVRIDRSDRKKILRGLDVLCESIEAARNAMSFLRKRGDHAAAIDVSKRLVVRFVRADEEAFSQILRTRAEEEFRRNGHASLGRSHVGRRHDSTAVIEER